MGKLRGLLMVIVAAGSILVNVGLHTTPAAADPVSGAIFTTDSSGLEVNVNQYAAKPDVYLNGGPGVHAPPGAAGLSPDGKYIFQVTDPSGKTLLSQDAAQCREVIVSGGVIVGVTGPCPHATGLSLAPGEVTVQLCTPPDPGSCFDDTPNPGGVYKAWVTPINDFMCPLTAVDCGTGKHGFISSDSKTDNFKVKSEPIREIDTQFFDPSTGQPMDGFGVTWTDPLGATNVKWSYLDLALDVHHEAHVEAVEKGAHLITIGDQAGCTVGNVYLNGSLVGNGPETVKDLIPGGTNPISDHISVYCQ
jgi:hypothetical protein